MDSPSDSPQFKPRDRVLRRLAAFGVPRSYLDRLFEGLVDFAKENRPLLPELVSTILPTTEEVAEGIHDAKARSKKLVGISMKSRFRESMLWLQWLMFEADPTNALKDLATMNVGQRGVCGAVWGSNDIAYRCRTCEHDSTCAICVPCFQNGNHQDHDFSIIYTGGGCCDCGDETAWKRVGFCSRHQGAEKIQPLPENLANSIGPVLDSVFFCWKEKLFSAESVFLDKPRANDSGSERRKVANELTFAVVEMLLEFCACSESLLSFMSKRVIATVGLLDILVRAEKFLIEPVFKKLHELLLKLLGEPVFKYEFSKCFLSYYPDVISDSIKEFSDDALKKRYPMLGTFSVQIFTVPTLTPRLVKEMNLLEMLFGCLGDIFVSCAGEDGRLQPSKWGSLFETSNRVLGDIRFAMSHDAVAKYATHDQPVISRTWLKLLTFVQGMNPLKRETGLHIEEENESINLLFILGHPISIINSFFIEGALSSDNAEDNLTNMHAQEMLEGDGSRHAKVGRLSEESSIRGLAGRSGSLSVGMKVDEVNLDAMSDVLVPTVVKRLVFECLQTLENWLGVHDGASSSVTYGFLGKPGHVISSREDFVALKKTLSRIFKRKYIFGRLSDSSEDHIRASLTKPYVGFQSGGFVEDGSTSSADSRKTIASSLPLVASASADSDHTTDIKGDIGIASDVLRIFNLSEWPDIIYDVSSQEISLHIPLHRLLSLLLQKALRRNFGESALANIFLSCSTSSLMAVTGEFFGHILRGCHPYGFAAFVMEHPLRIRVFSAQVSAGMWLKNGDVASVVDWYRSVQWPEQGLELDLFLLQCCAALAPPDKFLTRIIERFGLSSYLSLSLERSSEYEPVLVQEMLMLIMQVLQERHFSGLTVADSLKRELIYKLAIGDCTHSQLVKSLPRDLSKSDQLQEIISKVASYSNPSGLNQGMYSLRLQYWKELDLYHPRWNSRDLQVAQERYSRFCGVSALITQLPSWTKIYPPLEGLAGLATCRVMLQIIRAVLFYAVSSDKAAESRAPDGILIIALHLLSLALNICVQQSFSEPQSYHGDLLSLSNFACEEMPEAITYGVGEQSLLSLLVKLMRMHIRDNGEYFPEGGNCSFYPLIESLIKKFAEIDSQCMCKLRQLAPEVIDHLYPSPPNNQAVPGSPSDTEKRKAKARERQAAIMEKMKAEQSKFLSTVDSDGDDDSASGADSASDVEDGAGNTLQDVCSLCHDSDSKSPVSFLILLQKSRLLSFVDKGCPAWNSTPKENTSVLRKDQIGASASTTSGLTLSPAEHRSEDTRNESAYNDHVRRRDVKSFLELIRSRFASVKSISASRMHSDVNESTPYDFETLEEDLYTRIYQEMCDKMLNENIKRGEGAFIAKGFSSAGAEPMLREEYVSDVPKSSHESVSATASTNVPSVWALGSTSKVSLYDGFGPAECDGIYISSCGHGVHQSCLERYLSSLRERYVRRNIFEGAHIVDPDQGEFLCPVCRRLANSVLPAVPGSIQMAAKQPVASLDSSSGPFSSRKPDEMFSVRIQQALSLLHDAAYVVGRPKTFEALPLQRKERPNRNLDLVVRVLSKMYSSKKLDRDIASPKLNHSIVIWDTLKYSLMSTEVAARGGKSSMNPNYSLKSLFKEFRSSSEFILSLLLKVVQSTRKTNSSHVLQRFRGLQLFMHSICLGVSFGGSELEDSLIVNALRHDDIEASYPDIQLWNRASDPIIARDPFSSLMWVVFCLPCPFLSCKESLLSLIHLFYAVSIVQALIAYCGQYRYNIDEVDPESLVAHTYKMVGEFEYMRQYFVTSCIETSENIEEFVRRLSFPYLRRCALLWTLLNSSAPTPVFERDKMLDSDVNMIDVSMDGSVELSEVRDLEKMFEIPSIDVLLQNGMLRSLSSKWFHHFCKEHESQRFQSVLHCNPAAPFKLMNLPHIYQDLLQRYIKQSCPDCKAVLDAPALCLLCGRLCSPHWKSCCSQSGCLPHAMACGAGIGVFLLIKRTTILLQRSARQAPWPSPYLDAFGEEDVEMHRGKPLYLNEERYAALSYMVASHGLDRSSKVLGQTTIDSKCISVVSQSPPYPSYRSIPRAIAEKFEDEKLELDSMYGSSVYVPKHLQSRGEQHRSAARRGNMGFVNTRISPNLFLLS